MKLKKGGWILGPAAASLVFFACAPKHGAVGPAGPGKGIAWVTGGSAPFQEIRVGVIAAPPDVVVDASRAHQTLEGFGGAFNEKGWEALSVLAPADRNEVIARLFDPKDGIALRIGRVPIGASDYAIDRYTEDETPDDFALRDFSIDRDRQRLIPYIQAAMTSQAELRLWASAWTPPTWMKDNSTFDSGSLRDDPRVYASYADYLTRFMTAYRSAGLPLEIVAVQNEPLIATPYPSCLWTPSQYLTFVRDHMGPAFRRAGFTDAIMLGTFNEEKNLAHAQSVLNDEAAAEFVSIVGLQWDGIALVPQLSVPSRIRLWQTETDCGNWPWRPGFDRDRPPNDLTYAGYTWAKMRDYLKAGVTVYSMWNMVLDETGKSIDAKLPWPQNSAVVVNMQTKTVTYTPMYYAFGSFSRFVPPGSKRLHTHGAFENAVGFSTPGDTTTVVLYNAAASALVVKVQVGDATYGVPMAAQSFATLVVAPS